MKMRGGGKVLRIINRTEEISFPKLMEVYSESIENTAAQEWPNLPKGIALHQVDQDFRGYLHEVFFRTPNAAYAIWELDGSYVSALRVEPYLDGLLIEALETTPCHRRKGYAKDLLQAVLRHYTGKKIYSHIERRNYASISVHRSCGFRLIKDHAVFIDGSVSYRSDTFCFEA